jgi:hypothetical protein
VSGDRPTRPRTVIPYTEAESLAIRALLAAAGHDPPPADLWDRRHDADLWDDDEDET